VNDFLGGGIVMYEERERFSWTSLFIKIIIIVIFVLFTIWLLQLSMKSANKDMSNGINALTDKIFSENIEKMKDVGQSYFTTERLPKKVGEVKRLTLEEMYKMNLILEVKDKNGKACSKEKSYVEIEKLENEYQMKTYLDCGKEHNFIRVIMGCYSYCETDICEKKETPSHKAIEYEYSKSTGGAWGPWSSWSDWSKTEVSKSDSRDVETKNVSETYTYEKPVTETKYMGVANVCASISGYTLTSNKDGVCTYSKGTTSKTDPVCPKVDNYTLTGRSGFTCSYKQTNPSKANPVCPEVSGYNFVSRNGFTCNYSAPTTQKANPVCPEVSGYNFVSRNGFTCNYSNTYTSSTDYDLVYYGTGSGSYVPADTSTRHYVQSSADYQYKCTPGCAFQWYYTYKIYTKQYKTVTETTTRTASCPSGYTQSGNECVKSGTTTTTRTASCPSGYTKSGNECVKSGTTTTTKTASCPSGYTKSGNECVKYPTTTKTASCPSGYTKSGDTCIKSSTSTTTKNATCPSGQTLKDKKCYKDVTTMVTVEGTRNVTYYRYRTREYSGGSIDYKWSPSNNDKTLLDAGYKLTGKTREVGGK
jgi:hypothetical protein